MSICTIGTDEGTAPTNGPDDQDRLVGWNRADSNLAQSWALSLVGDWDSFTENTTTQSRTHGNAHEILTADSQSVTHDAKGNQTGLPSNLTTSTSGLTLDWDFENKLHAADVDGTSGADILQKFDALGRRISRDDGTATTVFVPSGQQTIADYTAGTAASSPTYRYVYASYIDEPVMRAGSTSTAKLYYHRNQQYSVTALTDTTATIMERYAYDAYGKLTVLAGGGTVLSGSAYGNRYAYTGREWDEELGLYHYRARMYSPDMGRFVSRDPIGYEGGNSLFAFVGNMPLRFVDPSGLYFVECRNNRVASGTIFRHCELKRNCTPGERDTPFGKENVSCSPVKLSTRCSRMLIPGDRPTKSCCHASNKEILDCLDRNRSGAALNSIPGSNCQSDTIESLKRCCLITNWKPNWFAYGGSNCAVGHWETETTWIGLPGGDGYFGTRRVWVCDQELPTDWFSNDFKCVKWHTKRVWVSVPTMNGAGSHYKTIKYCVKWKSVWDPGVSHWPDENKRM